MKLMFRVALAVAGLALSVGCSRQSDSPSSLTLTQAPVAVAPAPVPAWTGPLVELRGDGRQIGQQHGQLLGEPITFLHDNYLKVYLGGGAQRLLALGAARLFENYFQPEHRAEVDALARGTGINEAETVLAQCFLDLSPMEACSTITLPASAAPDRVARFGRNLEFMSLDVADKYSTVFVYHPTGRYQFVSIGWPGMMGVLSGMNEHGLALANMEVTREPRFPGAMPYTLLYRTVLERCKTVDEAIDLIRHTPRQTANNLMLMDAAGDRAVVEITPDDVEVRRAPAHEPLVSTNHQRGSDCQTTGRCWRYDRLNEMGRTQFGKADLKTVEHMLARVSPGKETLQSMVFEPANRVVYLSTGSRAASGTFYKVDLTQYFR